MLKFLKFVFAGPTPQDDHLTVRIHLTSGAELVTYHVKTVEVKKTAEGGFFSYNIEWHTGYKPAIFSLALGHISAIVATRS